MSSKVSKTSSSLLIASIVTIIVILINFQHLKRFAYSMGNDFFFPFLEAPSKAKENILNPKLLTYSKQELAEAVERFKRANDKLVIKNNQMEDLIAENKMMRGLLELSERSDFKYIFSEIHARDPKSWEEQLTIDKGSYDGILLGAPVLTRRYNDETSESELAVVGRITDLTKHTAVVSTLLSRNCKLGAYLPHSKSTGIISGGGREGNELWSKITYLPRDLDYKVKEPVYTSGASKLIPSNLLLGQLVDDSGKVHRKNINNLYNEIRFKPSADILNIEFLLVLVKK